MQFDGMTAPREGVPSVEIVKDAMTFDLHNDGELRELCYEYSARVLRIGWTLKEPAWTVPDRRELFQRAVVAAAILVVSGVRRVRMAGDLVTSPEHEAACLEFFEYQRLAPGLGELRFVLSNEAEFAVTGSRCELLTVGRQ